MKKLVIVLISGILVFAMGSGQARPEAAQAKTMVKITGRVTDFEGRPVEGAAVELKNSRFENATEGVSDKDGRYAHTVSKGTSRSILVSTGSKCMGSTPGIRMAGILPIRSISGP